jgi:alkanesulfonate monooxygenase SsuD/methylene tetrahydromethanopterin reductase-like flavin-dependent oxidoreductase (luciferase family)
MHEPTGTAVSGAATSPVQHPWVAEGQQRIRFGISIYPQSKEWADFFEIVQRIEALGYDSCWSYDHPTARADCWTALAALATQTSTIRLGTMIDCIYYRPVYLLARQAADVDRLSGGRLVLGIGIGDAPDEFADMGIPYPPAKERQQTLEEAIAILHGLWGTEPFEFNGQYLSAKNKQGFHPPVQQPHIPILIAGGGEKVTLRQVAKYADMSNFGSHVTTGGAYEVADVVRKYDVLRGYCEEIDRPFDHILRSHFQMPLILVERADQLDARLAEFPKAVLENCKTSLVAGTPEDAIRYYQSLVDAGVQYFVANILDQDWQTIELLAREVMPAFG